MAFAAAPLTRTKRHEPQPARPGPRRRVPRPAHPVRAASRWVARVVSRAGKDYSLVVRESESPARSGATGRLVAIVPRNAQANAIRLGLAARLPRRCRRVFHM